MYSYPFPGAADDCASGNLRWRDYGRYIESGLPRMMYGSIRNRQLTRKLLLVYNPLLS